MLRSLPTVPLMEEDGAVVYYEGSPGALHVDGGAKDELIVKDRGAFANPVLGGLGGRKWEGLAWRFLGNRVSRWTNERYLAQISSEIQASLLLTDEDLELLQAAAGGPTDSTRSCTHFTTADSTHNHTHPIQDDAHSKRGLLFLTRPLALFPVVAAIGWWLHPFSTIVGVAMLFLFLGSRHLLRRWSDHVTSRAHASRVAYYSAMDKLLTQLTVTIRWLQEMEVVSRGLTRPHPSFPITRLDQGHTHKLLRRRVLCTCADVLGSLRVATRKLCGIGGVTLAPELEDRGSYLAFSSLRELHQYLSEDSDRVTVNWDRDALSLQSIKDACSLVAVQNSELLRRVALIAAVTYDPVPRSLEWALSPWRWRMSLVEMLSQHLVAIVPLLKDGVQQLNWSLTFHQNMLLETTPTRPTMPKVSQVDPDLCPLVEEVHCLDLKTQCLLQRVRDMGVSLQCHGNQVPPVEVLENHLSAIQANLKGVEDLVGGVSALLQRGVEPEANMDGSKCSSETDDSEIDSRVDTSGHGLPGAGERSDCSEEEVFEGYVDEDSIGGGHDQWEEPTDGVAREVPAHVLTELKSVLTVRNHERERKRISRHGHQRGVEPASCDPPSKGGSDDTSHDQDPTTPGDYGQKGVEPMSRDPPMESCDNGEDPIPLALDTPDAPKLELDHPLPSIGHSPISLSAEMAAAIKGRKFRNTEDIFS